MLAQERFQKNVIVKRVARSDNPLSWVKPRRRPAPYGFSYLLYVSVVNAQYPVVDAIANKVAQKYQTSSCEQLWQQESPEEASDTTRAGRDADAAQHPKMRASFVNIVAAPVVNKMDRMRHDPMTVAADDLELASVPSLVT
jgi:hypothetical protein